MMWRNTGVQPAISVNGVSKRFRVITIRGHGTLKETMVNFRTPWSGRRGGRFVQAVDGVTFSVPRGATLGIIGRNGSGKTSLMRLLAGVYSPDRGTVRVAGTVAPLLSLGVGFHPEMSGRENLRISGLVLGLSPRQIDGKADEIIDFAELREFIDFPIRAYSSGMHMRLAFSVAMSVEPDVLLLDEVLSVGDESFAAKCLARMERFKEQKKTICLVSHDGNLVASWCDLALWIDHGKVRQFGPSAEVAAAYHHEMQNPPSESVV